MASKKHKVFRIIWFSLVAVFLVWQWTVYQSRDLPKDTFVESATLSIIETDDIITFSPKSINYNSEIVFFQGGLVDPKAYAPLCRRIAENGYVCYLIKCDWRMPVWYYEDIKSLFDLKSGQYILGGHSQGAKMAAQFVFENPNDIKGLFLIGTSHPRDFDLSKL